MLLIPGLDSTKEEFFTLEEVFLRARHGDAVARRPGPGRGRLPAADPARLRGRGRRRCSTRSTAARTSTSSASARSASASAATTRRARRRSSRGSAPSPGSAAPFNFGALWDHVAGAHPRDVRAKSGARDEDDARERALALDLDGVLERLDRPALFVTGRLDRLIPWESTERQAHAAPAGRVRRARGGQPRMRERAVPRRARWSPTGCASGSGELDRPRRSAARGRPDPARRAGATSTTSSARACCTPRSCAARTHGRGSSASACPTA